MSAMSENFPPVLRIFSMMECSSSESVTRNSLFSWEIHLTASVVFVNNVKSSVDRILNLGGNTTNCVGAFGRSLRVLFDANLSASTTTVSIYAPNTSYGIEAKVKGLNLDANKFLKERMEGEDTHADWTIIPKIPDARSKSVDLSIKSEKLSHDVEAEEKCCL